MSKIIPISPKEAKEQIEKNFPDFVIEGVNNAINKHYFGKSSFNIKQREILTEVLKVAPEGITEQQIYDNHWMDFENLYRKFGWVVKYDKPGYCENYDAFFTFKPKND